MIYRSKIDYWLIIILIVPLGCAIWEAINKQNWIQFLIFSILTIIISFSFSTLKYIIEDDFLIVKMKFYTFNRINIHEIKSIEKSNNLLSSPALSMDRLSIKFGKFEEVLISPKDKELFIKDLLSIKSTIKV
jgi:hypothetical protein